MADNDVGGQLRVLVQLCEAEPWDGIWHELECELQTFDDVGLAPDASDAEVWRTCQQYDIVLITGNRNAEGRQSLEATIRAENEQLHLPVLTLADQDRFVRDRSYAELAVERMLEILLDINSFRGTGRLYFP